MIRLDTIYAMDGIFRRILSTNETKGDYYMNKTELISTVAEKTALSKKDTAALADGDEVRLVGFGTFEVKRREARMGRNPKTKEAIPIPASKVPAFKPGKALKEAIAQS